MPFAGYEDFDACVSDNQDKSDPAAYCAAIKQEVEQQGIEAQDATEVFEDVDSCEVAMDGAGLDNPREVCEQLFADPQLSEPIYVRLADTRQPGVIERVEQDDGSVRYKNLKLIGVGIWGDSGTQSHFLYSERTIEALADNVVGTTANLFHEQDNEIANVGDLDPDSVYIGDQDHGLYGDLVLDRQNAASEFADDALRNALETKGRQGIKGPSLEIKNPEYEYNLDSGAMEVVDGEIHGVALVGLGVSAGPGSRDVAIDRQTATRAVALADAGDPTVITLQSEDYGMTMDTETIREQLSDRDIQLGDDVDDDTLQALADALDLQEDDEDEEEMEDEEMEEEAEESESDDDEPDDDDEVDVDVNLEDVAARVDEISQQVQANSERLESMAEEFGQLSEQTVDIRESEVSLSDLSERLDTLAGQDTVADLDERLTQLEESLEEPKSLADIGDREPSYGDDGDDLVVTGWGRTYRTNYDSFAVR